MSTRTPIAVPHGAVLLTGATGFLGMELLARYLERTDRHVVALIRAADDREADGRLRATLAALGGDRDGHAGRVTAVAGDLTTAGLGLGRRWAGLARRIGEIVHGAASVAFDLPLEGSRAINVEGTRRMLRFARACTALERFTYVSTAYVAGDRGGTVYEDDEKAGPFRNAYEQSKHEAERLVVAERERLPVTVARPSIVVGDRATGWTSSFNVLYAPLRAFAAGAYPVLPGRRRAPIDVVSVDYVADAIQALTEAPEATGQTYHLVAGRHASSVAEIVRLGSARFGHREPRMVPPGLYRTVVAPLVAKRASRTTRRVLERSEVYFPYFAMRQRFDDARARALLEPRGIAPVPLRDYFERLVDFAQAARWGRRPIGRADAAELAGSPAPEVRRPAPVTPAGRPARTPAR